MRSCSKPNCADAADATVVLRYARQEVVVSNLLPERDRNLVELCMRHADRLTAPLGWSVRDERTLRWATSPF